MIQPYSCILSFCFIVPPLSVVNWPSLCALLPDSATPPRLGLLALLASQWRSNLFTSVRTLITLYLTHSEKSCLPTDHLWSPALCPTHDSVTLHILHLCHTNTEIQIKTASPLLVLLRCKLIMMHWPVSWLIIIADRRDFTWHLYC